MPRVSALLSRRFRDLDKQPERITRSHVGPADLIAYPATATVDNLGEPHPSRYSGFVRQIFVIAASALLLCASSASADVIHLHNGRTMEGKVVKTKRGQITLKVPGGMLTIPASTVKRIERRRTPHEEYARRARRVDMSDARQVEALATLASSRGLGEQAKHLRALAMGLVLEKKVARIRGRARAQEYLDLYQWARNLGYSDEVQRWLLDEALEIDPEHASSLRALRRMVESQEARVVSRHELARRDRKRPKAKQANEAAEAEKAAEAKQVAELEAQLADQKTKSEDLKKRLEELEKTHDNRRRRRRRSRFRGQQTVLVEGAPGIWVRRVVLPGEECKPR